MDLYISHAIRVVHAEPLRYSIQALRLKPASTADQSVMSWAVEAAPGTALTDSADHFGNRVHLAVTRGPHSEIVFRAGGQVRTRDTHGILSGVEERFPPRFFLRTTPLTRADDRLDAFVRKVADAQPDALSIAHKLMIAIRESMRMIATGDSAAGAAAAAFERGRGTPVDLAHIFIAGARRLGIPARFAGGYVWEGENQSPVGSRHAWAEAFIAGLGWVGFDCASCRCPTEAYIRVASGLDSLDASPLRIAGPAGSEESLDVTVRMAQSVEQAQA